jgi:hypothetical protein
VGAVFITPMPLSSNVMVSQSMLHPMIGRLEQHPGGLTCSATITMEPKRGSGAASVVAHVVGAALAGAGVIFEAALATVGVVVVLARLISRKHLWLAPAAGATWAAICRDLDSTSCSARCFCYIVFLGPVELLGEKSVAVKGST